MSQVTICDVFECAVMKHRERMDCFVAAGLYLVTSQSFSCGRSTLDIVKSAVSAGARLIQLREKELAAGESVKLAHQVRKVTQDAGALLIINDRLDIALAVGADGVHLGQDDLPIREARAIAPELIIGASSHDVEEAVEAEAAGASYVNIGPLFPTQTKVGYEKCLGLEGLREISATISIPFTVMGGIKREHIADLLAAGAQSIALVTAVTAADDPGRAVADLLEQIRPS